MHTWRCLFGLLLPLSVLGVPAAATISDSTYSSPDLRTSTISPWNPAKPIRAARAWETAVRLPGRVVSLPFVAAGALAQGSMVFLDRTNSWDRAIRLGQAAHRAGIEVLPASLGDHTGIGGELRWAPPYIDRRLLVEVNATTNQYNRERVTGSAGPVSAVYSSSWRPRELYFGPGLGAEHSGESTYGERSQSATLVMTWGWQHFDSARVRPFEPLMFRDRARVRGPSHRTWADAWAGPRDVFVTRGRDPMSPSFEIPHPVEAAGSLERRVDQFTYGAGFSHDARSGRPHWSSGWRASVDAERFDKAIRALALKSASTDARSFTRLTYHLDTGVSSGRDPRTLRLALTVVDQTLDLTEGTFLIGDLPSLGGSSGLAGFEAGRFTDLDLLLARVSYLFPLVKNLEFELHTESGGVYPDMRQARIATFRYSTGASVRLRTEMAMLGAFGCDWSSEQARIWFALGGIE